MDERVKKLIVAERWRATRLLVNVNNTHDGASGREAFMARLVVVG